MSGGLFSRSRERWDLRKVSRSNVMHGGDQIVRTVRVANFLIEGIATQVSFHHLSPDQLPPLDCEFLGRLLSQGLRVACGILVPQFKF